jgi:hypothetical protein
MTIFLDAFLLTPAPSHMRTAQLTTLIAEPSGGRALLPNAAVFFLPKSSVLSALAMNIVAQAARKVAPGTIAIIQANYDQAAGETAETALLRGAAVREELVREGVPSSSLRTLIEDATGTGIEARCVVVSVIPVKALAPRSPTS